MRPVAQATGWVAYLSCGGYYTMPRIGATRRVVYYARRSGIRLPLLCFRYIVTYMHHQNNTYVTLFAGLQLWSSRLYNAWWCLYLSSAGSHMPHSHSCLALRFCHLLQYSLHFGYIACRCICFPIIVLYMSEIYCPIFTLSSTIPSVLHILGWSIIGLQCFFVLIRIVAILTLIPVDISGSQVKPTMPLVLYIVRWSIIGLRCFFLLIRIRIIAILAVIPGDITGSQV